METVISIFFVYEWISYMLLNLREVDIGKHWSSSFLQALYLRKKKSEINIPQYGPNRLIQ